MLLVIAIITFASILYIIDSHKIRRQAAQHHHVKHHKKSKHKNKELIDQVKLTKEDAAQIAKEYYPNATILKNKIKETNDLIVFCTTLKEDQEKFNLIIDANEGSIIGKNNKRKC